MAVPIITPVESVVFEAIAERHAIDGLGATVPEIMTILDTKGLTLPVIEVAEATEQLLGVQTIMVHKLQQRDGWPVWKIPAPGYGISDYAEAEGDDDDE